MSARYVPHPEWSTLPPCLVVPGSFNPLHRGASPPRGPTAATGAKGEGYRASRAHTHTLSLTQPLRLSAGHVEMALAARQALGKDLPILFELSVHNVDKASVSLEVGGGTALSAAARPGPGCGADKCPPQHTRRRRARESASFSLRWWAVGGPPPATVMSCTTRTAPPARPTACGARWQ